MCNIQYWAFKHKPGQTANEQKSIDYVLQAIRNNYCCMQYEYTLQDKKIVTQNWNRMLSIKEGDIIFLRGDKKIYAWGYAIRPRLQPNVTLNAIKIIRDKNHGKYNSSEFKGIIHFEDSHVFYENLDGEGNWGQRIDVDSWRYYDANGIDAKSQSLYKDGENEYGVVKELKPEQAQQLINELYKHLGMTGDILTLLKTNKNVILTGAPGTGKTFLTKQIARLLLFGKKNEEELSDVEQKQFNEQCGFVQFHPSYDYTDFVEGLRPIQDKNGDVGFERKDGVFKAFCAKALKNFNDSKKTEDEISKEKKIDDSINTFISNAIDNNTEFEIANGNKFFITDFSDKSISISIPGNEKVKVISLSLSELKSLLSSDKQIDNGNDIRDFFNRKWRMQHDSYTIVLYKKIKAIKLADSQSVEKTELKNFVFIIDEINRGEISKIFGELFFSIDPGYRGEKGRVQTQYQNIVEDGDIFKKGFFVPENVYIIGTMNDIDRSVESMDFAFCRRFAFKEIKADKNVGMLDNLAQKVEAIKRMKNLNAAIEKIDGLSSAYHIGASYFLKLANYKKDDGTYDFDKLWEYHLEGLLFEYLRGTTDIYKKLKELAQAYGYTNANKYE